MLAIYVRHIIGKTRATKFDIAHAILKIRLLGRLKSFELNCQTLKNNVGDIIGSNYNYYM